MTEEPRTCNEGRKVSSILVNGAGKTEKQHAKE